MAQPRLKSSFIYLANAVNDLRGNWAVLAMVLSPLVLAAALCLLPDAINLQNRLVFTFEPGTQSISYHNATPVQEPYQPDKSEKPDSFPRWLTTTLHLLLLVITEAVVLATMCMLRRVQAGLSQPDRWRESFATLKYALTMAPAFFWLSFLKFAALVAAGLLFGSAASMAPGPRVVMVNIGLGAVLLAGLVIYLFLYFAQYALIFGGLRSFHALLASRDLMRKRFFKVAIRIGVFVAVYTGYNSWSTGARVVASILLGPIGVVVTGSIWGAIFILNILGFAVAFATAAFFTAAGLRLYQDLAPQQTATLQTTNPLNGGNLSAASQPAPGV
jgi:uncharacterized membrane protein YqaE (UPF0057 family)